MTLKPWTEKGALVVKLLADYAEPTPDLQGFRGDFPLSRKEDGSGSRYSLGGGGGREKSREEREKGGSLFQRKGEKQERRVR